MVPKVFKPLKSYFISVTVLSLRLLQGHQNDFEIGEVCLTSAEGVSVKGKYTREGAPISLGGGFPEKILKFMNL